MRHTLTDHRPATLHDAGELAVVTEGGERTLHRHALVLTFASEREMYRAIEAQGCAYQARAELAEQQLRGRRHD